MCKKQVEWGRWKIMLVKIINIKQIELERWKILILLGFLLIIFPRIIKNTYDATFFLLHLNYIKLSIKELIN